MKNQKSLFSTIVGVIAGAGVGMVANGVLPAGGSSTTTMIANAAKIVGGVYFAAKQRGKNASTMMAAGFGLAAEGASELIVMYTREGGPDGYEGPSLFGFPGVYQAPYYSLNGIAALGDAGVTEAMRY